MAKILEDVQSKFVLTVDINGEPRVVQQVFLDGDQLTEERARNAQLANALAERPVECLCGLETAFADWHLCKNFLEVRF